jgi:transposase-like protein
LTVISTAEKRRIVVEAEKLLAEPGASQRTVAPKLGIGQSTLSEWMKEHGGDTASAGEVPAGITREGGEVSIASKPSPDADKVTAEQLLKKHGFDPADWIITSVRVSEWGKEEAPMFQLRVNATRKDNLLVIPDLGDFEPWPYGQIEECASRQVALIPDLHAPYHNERALRAVCDLLVAEEPEEVVFLGDVADYSQLSKHRTHSRFGAKLNETNTAVVQNFRRVREAVPEARIVLVPGNHDVRLLYYCQDFAPELDAARPGIPIPRSASSSSGTWSASASSWWTRTGSLRSTASRPS